ncbi:MAG TPA: type II toxin-antitoxin system RelE/ParE family toxin [Cyanobacteria bacterium UBA11369]|nr:type II toxin-antitoxin system RelE/ParE family toxin [Cyanobacteria bacterium UBA11371]HBE31861.1 type II toxin-antitoxin system RelE/ParE family toxin [Cyanobacteria bacterium UBA11368]HBE53582.1 type II toxin-antitoxin system RelE/ParE family toxin [Cyanobacteria bacterium UBA11369]
MADYIASQSGLDQADRFLNKLDVKFAKIAQFPNIGRQRDEILPGLRSLPMDNYLILYMPIGQDVEIFRVVSGYRDLSALFTDADD